MEQMVGDKGHTYDHEIFYQMEQGKVSSDEFRNGVLKLLPNPVSYEADDDAGPPCYSTFQNSGSIG